MTRSVEIPEAAVAKGAERLWLFRTPIAKTRDSCTEQAREVIEAALPYLVPADSPTLDLEEVLLILAQFDVGGWKYDNPQEFRDRLGAALVKLRTPVGDGGLQEALESLVEHWRYKSEDLRAWQEGGGPDPYEAGLDDAATALNKLLAAAPAVPQPVDREALRVALEQALGLSKGVLATTHQNHGFDSGCPVCRGKSAGIAEAVVDDVLALLAGEQEQVER